MTPPYSLLNGRNKAFYDTAQNVQELYRYIEYIKWRVDAEWYTTLVGKLVLKTQAKIGLLGRWSKKTDLSPFERYDLGGDGLSNQNFGLNGRDIISLRGYDQGDIMANLPGGAGVFNKYTVELRYPISLNPQSTIFVTASRRAAMLGNAPATSIHSTCGVRRASACGCSCPCSARSVSTTASASTNPTSSKAARNGRNSGGSTSSSASSRIDFQQIAI